MKNYYLKSLILFTLLSCSSKHIEQSENTVIQFFEAVKEADTDIMSKKYKDIIFFDSYYKSDSINIIESKKINDSIISVKVKNFFTNGFGKKSIKKIFFYVSRDSINVFSKIIDSKGLTNHKENELYDFAKKTGCLTKTDSTDVQRNLKFKVATNILHEVQLETLLDFMTNVKVANWSWRSGYGGSASGKGIVKNNTTFSIPKVKYVIKYTNGQGNVLTTDDGYVSYDKINVGESKSFTFYTSYVSNASSAIINLDFDEEMIKEYVLKSKEYDGNEYEQYLIDNPK